MAVIEILSKMKVVCEISSIVLAKRSYSRKALFLNLSSVPQIWVDKWLDESVDDE